MEAHAGTITERVAPREHPGTLGSERMVKPRRRLLSLLRAGVRRRRSERAERAYRLRASGRPTGSIPGSEHAHLLKRPRGF